MENETLEKLKDIISMSSDIYDSAYTQYSLLVNENLSKPVISNEPVERLLDELLSFCDDERIMSLYKQLCRHFYRYYPNSAKYYAKLCIDMYFKEDSLQ